MKCRIEFPNDDLQRFSPNLEFLASVLEVLAPEALRGEFSFDISVSGLRICFVGVGNSRGRKTESAVIPRWMFCEEAFRELIVAKAQTFIASVKCSVAPTGKIEAEPEREVVPGWLL